MSYDWGKGLGSSSIHCQRTFNPAEEAHHFHQNAEDGMEGVHRFLATKKYLPRRCCRDVRSRVCSTTIYRVNESVEEKLPRNNFQKCVKD